MAEDRPLLEDQSTRTNPLERTTNNDNAMPWYRRRTSTLGLLILCLAAVACGYSGLKPLLNSTARQPNILFILSDDQDLHMDSLEYMPLLKKHITDEGTYFRRHYCTVALCCPSRVSMWTGKAAHNTNVTDINPPYGGYPKFISQGFNDKYLPVWLQAAGYNTYYVGKLFNAMSTSNYDTPHAAGWTGSDFLLDPFTYEYYNSTMQRNFDPPVSYEGNYSTDVVAEKGYGFLDDALKDSKPFFITIAPVAPHSNVHINVDMSNGGGNYTGSTATQSPPRPAERHKDLFKDVVVPRTPNFNPDHPNSGASWISTLPKQNQTNIDYNDEWYRDRLRALQAVDEMIDEVMKRLDAAGVLDETYVFFSTDNGYTIGQHRRQPGKQCAFQEDINIPLMVRGPGIPKGHTTDIVTTHTDMAPTFLELAGVGQNQRTAYELDGSAIPLRPHQLERAQYSWSQEHVNVEMWGIILSEGKYGFILYPNHTYKALRVVGNGYSLLYTVWCNGDHELYDVTKDPWELNNIYDANSATPFEFGPAISPIPGHEDVPAAHISSDGTDNVSYFQQPNITIPTTTTTEKLIARLDALLLVLKTCKQDDCRYPWNALHPADNVRSLREALEPRYDAFYASRPKIAYERCEIGYITSSEGVVWDNSLAYSGGMDHELWLGT